MSSKAAAIQYSAIHTLLLFDLLRSVEFYRFFYRKRQCIRTVLNMNFFIETNNIKCLFAPKKGVNKVLVNADETVFNFVSKIKTQTG